LLGGEHLGSMIREGEAVQAKKKRVGVRRVCRERNCWLKHSCKQTNTHNTHRYYR